MWESLRRRSEVYARPGADSRLNRDDDLDGELRDHMDLEGEECIEAGLAPDRAREAVVRASGSMARTKEDVREAWGWMSLERLTQDLNLAVRLMLKNPEIEPAFT